MATQQLPKHGQTVVFTKVPPGSFTTAGVTYRVRRKGDQGTFRFENVERGSATYDQPWAVEMAVWSEVA